jgi:repressor LexA
MTLGEFVSNYRLEHGLSQRQFATKCGVSNGYVSMIEKNINPKTQQPLVPSIPALTKIASGMGLSLNDLFRQVDEMPVDISVNSQSDESTGKIPPGCIPLPRTKRVPLIGRVACGEPITAEENLEGYVDAPENCRCDFCLICCGDSMIDANIQDGDLVYVRAQPTVENGQIAVVRIGGEATLKRVYISQDCVTLVPANSSYAPITFTGESMRDVHIEGKAIGFMHLFK